MADVEVSPFMEYAVGQVLTLGLMASSTIRVRIRQLHTRTLSCTMVVDILSQGESGKCNIAFLKLFDRRFSDGLRENDYIQPWEKEMEEAYIESVEDGEVYQFLHDLHTIENFQENTENDWYDSENETFLADTALKLYESELATYKALMHYQGRHIPRLLAAVELDLDPKGIIRQQPNAKTIEECNCPGEKVSHDKPGNLNDQARPSDQTERCKDGGTVSEGPTLSEDANVRERFEPFKVKGLLLEHINGCNMWDIVDHFPRSSWQELVDDAVKIVHILGDHSILNDDVSPNNFIVSTTKDGRQNRVCMIDFGLCRFRREDESDKDWGRAKNVLGEDRAVAARMQKFLGDKHDFELVFEPSLRYDKWAEGEQEEFMARWKAGMVRFSQPTES